MGNTTSLEDRLKRLGLRIRKTPRGIERKNKALAKTIKKNIKDFREYLETIETNY